MAKLLSLFALLHALVSTGAYLWSSKRSMEVAYRGAPHTMLDSILAIASNVLLSPVFAIFFHLRLDLLSGAGGYLVILANGLLWALVAWWAVRTYRRRAATTTA